MPFFAARNMQRGVAKQKGGRRVARNFTFVTWVAVAAALAHAAAASEGGMVADQDQLAEVIVTAQRVQSSESKTPISMEVFSQSELAAKGVVDIQTLAQMDPSVNFDTGNGNGYITMRGVSGQGGVGPAVPVAFDGFYYNLPYVFNNSLYDMNRIEVLRGPQGTLFGRNSTGGLVSVITNDPEKTFGGYGQITFGNYRSMDVEGALNLPFSDRVQLRLAFSSAQHSGYRNLIYGMGEVADDQDAKSARAKLAVEVTENLKLLATFQVTHVGGVGAADNIFVLPADANNFPTHVAVPLSGYNSKTYQVGFPSALNIDDRLLQLRAIYDGLPQGMTLTYLGGYDVVSDLHNTPVVGIDAAGPPYNIPSTIEILSTQTPRTNNQELRLASGNDQAVTWQGGLYYFHQHIPDNNTHFRDAATPAAPDLVSFPYDNVQESKAAYGQAGWHIDRVTLSAGLRYTSDYVAQTDLASPGDGIFPALDDIKFSKWTWHAGADWQVTDRSLIYAKADTGYRAGAFNLVVPCNCTGGAPQPSTILPYAPESVIAYEVGTKNRMLNERLLLNADAFYMQYKGQQITESNQGGIYTVNAKGTNIYGVESQFSALAEPVGRLDLNLSWLHARFAPQVLTNALNQVYSIGGNRLLQSPELSLTAGFEHDWKMSAGTFATRVETKYQSGQYFDIYNFADSYQRGFTRTDAHLIYNTTDEHLTVDVFVRNIENSLVIVDESESFAPPLSQPGTYNVGFQAPRTFGVMFRTRF
jgi:iron complex outermembrane recepter protein